MWTKELNDKVLLAGAIKAEKEILPALTSPTIPSVKVLSAVTKETEKRNQNLGYKPDEMKKESPQRKPMSSTEELMIL